MLYTNDEKMTYDMENHRYVLTANGFAQYAGYELAGRLDTESTDQELTIKFFLNRVSENVYGLLSCMTSDERGTQCFLALPVNRQKVYNALCRCASDMMTANADPLEGFEKPAVSVGLQVLLEPLYGNYHGGYAYGVDY